MGKRASKAEEKLVEVVKRASDIEKAWAEEKNNVLQVKAEKKAMEATIQVVEAIKIFETFWIPRWSLPLWPTSRA